MGWRHDAHGVDATGAMSASSIADWRAAIAELAGRARPPSRSWSRSRSCSTPERSMGPSATSTCPSLLRGAHLRPGLLRLLLRHGAGEQAADRLPARHRRRALRRARGTFRHQATAACCRSSTSPATRRSPRGRRRPRRSSGCERRPRLGPWRRRTRRRSRRRSSSSASCGSSTRSGSSKAGQRARQPDRPEDAEHAHAPLPARCVPGRRVGAEIAQHQARVEHLSGANETVDRSPVERLPADADAGSRHPLAGGRSLRARPRDDRPRHARRRDHRLRDDADRRRSGPGPGHAQPPRPPPPDAGPDSIRIHGLRSEDLVGAPPLSEVLGELLLARSPAGPWSPTSPRSRSGSCAAPCSPPGISFRNPVIDTYALAAELYSRRRRPGPRGDPARGLARELGLPVHRPHEADGDALTTAQVFLALATQLDAIEPQTIGSLCDAAPSLRARADVAPGAAAPAAGLGADPLALRVEQRLGRDLARRSTRRRSRPRPRSPARRARAAGRRRRSSARPCSRSRRSSRGRRSRRRSAPARCRARPSAGRRASGSRAASAGRAPSPRPAPRGR